MPSVLVYAKKPVAAVMMRPIIERLAREPQFEFYGCSRLFGRRDVGSVFRSAGLENLKPTPKWLARWRRFDLYLSADFGVVAPRARLKVHTFHGVSFRNHAVNAAALRYDLLLLAGPYMRRQFEQLGLVTKENESRFALVGMPKIDALVAGVHDRTAALTRLDLDPALPTILFAPTWSKKFSSLEVHREALIEALFELPYNVLVKLHDNSLDPRKATADWPAAFTRRHTTRLRFITEPNIVPLMRTADLLISDASSTANEYALLDRPIVFVKTPGLRDKLKAKADLDTWGQNAGVVVEEPSDLRQAIERELAEPMRLSAVRRALAADLFHEPGRATENAVRAILRALDHAK